MQFRVPQFLDIEDKIFGPLTFSEFVYLVGGAGLCYFIYKLIGLALGIIPIIVIAALSGALVFYKPNGKPFVNMIENSLNYYVQDRLYVWKRKIQKVERKEIKDINTEEASDSHVAKLNKSKLRDLAWSLDVLDNNPENKE